MHKLQSDKNAVSIEISIFTDFYVNVANCWTDETTPSITADLVQSHSIRQDLWLLVQCSGNTLDIGLDQHSSYSMLRPV